MSWLGLYSGTWQGLWYGGIATVLPTRVDWELAGERRSIDLLVDYQRVAIAELRAVQVPTDERYWGMPVERMAVEIAVARQYEMPADYMEDLPMDSSYEMAVDTKTEVTQ